MSHILEFWKNKELFNTKELLIEKINEYYSEEFISNYKYWKTNLDLCNEDYKQIFISSGYDDKYWENMSYDYFCKNIINSMIEFIKLKNDITSEDVKQILTIILDDYSISIMDKVPLSEYTHKETTINTLLNSLKEIKFKLD